MKLYHHNATAVLFEKATSIRDLPDSWRVIYLKLSEMPARYNRTLLTNFIVKNIAGVLSSEEGYIYLCSDNDIFILFQGRSKPMLKKLASIFGDIDPSSLQHATKSPFSVYDLSKDWVEFYELCFSKSMNEAYSRLLSPTIPRVYQHVAEEAPAP